MHVASRFQVGQQVTLHGLQSRTNLNGASGKVLSFNSSRKRYAVQVLSSTAEESVMVKQENLRQQDDSGKDEAENHSSDLELEGHQDTYYDSDEEEHARWEMEKLETKYIPAFRAFLEQKEAWRAMIARIFDFSWQQRAHLVMSGYDELLWGLHDRPKGLPMMQLFGENEIQIFCDAIAIGWRLWPDSWTGLQMMLDYLAESMSSPDLAEISDKSAFLAIIKEIAQHTDWPNNRLCGPMMTASAAKTILARISRNASFAQATTVSIVRCVAGLGFTPCQPDRGSPRTSQCDARRICDNVTCINVEKDQVKFKKCADCMEVAYCSPACQRAHWVAIHKRECGR